MRNSVEKIRTFVRSKFNTIKNSFRGLLKRLSPKPRKRPTRVERRIAREQQRRAILGIGLLLVVVSIAYSTAVIYIGVDSIESRIALIPQVVFALATLVRAFLKLYK